ncbi:MULTISPECIES: sigma-70 family RNA polymerase sigma factor [unclassified Thermoactinomyces]|jgi:RNA polymerase sigma factor|uniref:sigma-70 family RNA polymerase sigma factor n=1 Tax=unclassified Thermoactinomyces TaxID=2634588 RepID=UPI0018DBC1EF|nr:MULTISPECIES: sigma-70 family RNA polymerase sigma factor [unclassified Thermoactinomyces]MBH8598590.1 sigma-70 family RNA polymerase sigma factor [Thermoactinomyces sp. CICC 10523]MBH8604566.1 sigma-70 family RNA polymerase sigma factor [Thermoactinomyces sp. CICC 10522]MBH8606974.1 sigma-70 family RNA polymerase sigma factor [Thermoactinomyces sp. CICC 10521]
MFRGTDLEMRVLQVQETHSPEQRDELLRELEPHVRRIASRICRRVVTPHDDEYMIAYRAIDEAIGRYNPEHRATFLSFAYKVIQRRLVDYFRQEGRHQRSVPLSAPGAREEETHNQELVALSFERHKKEETDRLRRLEIEIFIRSLEKYGITLEELTKKSPKHRDTRESLLQVAKMLVSDKNLMQKFLSQKKTEKDLAKTLGLHRRTLNRHRNYLIALTIVVVEDLTLIRSYIGL